MKRFLVLMIGLAIAFSVSAFYPPGFNLAESQNSLYLSPTPSCQIDLNFQVSYFCEVTTELQNVVTHVSIYSLPECSHMHCLLLPPDNIRYGAIMQQTRLEGYDNLQVGILSNKTLFRLKHFEHLPRVL